MRWGMTMSQVGASQWDAEKVRNNPDSVDRFPTNSTGFECFGAEVSQGRVLAFVVVAKGAARACERSGLRLVHERAPEGVVRWCRVQVRDGLRCPVPSGSC